jgi:hypothetical protein
VHDKPDWADAPRLAYIKGQWEPFGFGDYEELNTHLDKLLASLTDMGDERPPAPTYFGAAKCDRRYCTRAASRTVVWVTSTEYVINLSCAAHAPDFDHSAEDFGGCPPHILTEPVHRGGRCRFLRTEPGEVRAFTWSLIGFDIPPAVFAQPACRKCKARIAPAAGDDAAGEERWQAADGKVTCPRGRNHAPSRSDVVTVLRQTPAAA